jgi:hypothetical protein
MSMARITLMERVSRSNATRERKTRFSRHLEPG